ncbi:MAG TPA: hypothetical protein DEQ02_01770 [Ruminococcaceae bacterium]|nr:hypothetical protein [Oscillospiraceae bacterium]
MSARPARGDRWSSWAMCFLNRRAGDLEKEKIGGGLAGFIMASVMFANILIIGFYMGSERDVWISLLLSLTLVIPLILIYARLTRLMPGMDIYGMAKAAFGKIGAGIVAFAFGFYCLHLASLTLGNYSEFIHLTALFKTPFIVIALGFFVVCIYIVQSGIQTLGKWSALTSVIGLAVLIIITALSTGQMDFSRLLPVMDDGFGEITVGALRAVPLHFGDAVVTLTLIGGLKSKKSPKSIYIISTVAVALILILIFIRNCTLMGTAMVKSAFFPTYKSVSLIKVSYFLERIESVLFLVYITLGMTKISVCIIGAAKGAATLFRLPSYKAMTVPVGFIAFALSSNLFHNIDQMFNFLEVYNYYALIFQVLIPVALWITAEVKHAAQKRKSLGSYQNEKLNSA